MRPDAVLHEAHVATRMLSDDQLSAIMRAMLTVSDLGFLITDLEHVALACNSKFGIFFGVDPHRVPTMEVEELREVVYPRLVDPAAWTHQLDDVYERPNDRHQDLLILENPFIVLKRVTAPVLGEDGVAIGRIWAFEDVTELQNRLRRQDAIYEVSTFNDPEPAKVCEMIVRRVAEFYDSMALLSICDGDRLVFRSVAGAPEWLGSISENTLTDSYCQFALRDLKSILIQDSALHPGASNVLPAQAGLCRYLGAPIIDAKRRAIGTVCILDNKRDEPLGPADREFLDVLANRLAVELEREAMIEERSKIVTRQLAETTSELSEARENLIQAEKLSVAGTLAATIAHDIKNILASFRLIVDQRQLTDAEKLVQVRTQADRFAILSHRLLSYVKPKSLSRERVDLVEIIRTACALLQSQADISGVKVSLQLPETLFITGDSHRIEHFLVNLMLNSIQAMTKGGTLAISLESEKVKILRIKDTGGGISVDMQSRMFEPFSSSRKDGFGLGLFSCMQIAREHGWSLEVESTVGVGTEFLVGFGDDRER
ncbi:MAG: GAF domain-containing sensor histidine kinase [Fimbriimonadaceae bacterium]